VFASLNLLLSTTVNSLLQRPWAYRVSFNEFNVVFDFNPDEIVFTIIKGCNLEFTKIAKSFKMERKKFFELD